MITKLEALEYECFGTKWYGYMFFSWQRNLAARMLRRKVDKKYAEYEAYISRNENRFVE